MTPISPTRSNPFAHLPDETLLNILEHSQNHTVVQLARTDRRWRRIVLPDLTERTERVRQAQLLFSVMATGWAAQAQDIPANLRLRYGDLSSAHQATLHRWAADSAHPNAVSVARDLISGLALMDTAEQIRLVRHVRDGMRDFKAAGWLRPFGDLARHWSVLPESARAELRPLFAELPDGSARGEALQSYALNLHLLDRGTRGAVIAAIDGFAHGAAEAGDPRQRCAQLVQALKAATWLQHGPAAATTSELAGIVSRFRIELDHLPPLRPYDEAAIGFSLVQFVLRSISLSDPVQDGAVDLLCASDLSGSLRNEVLCRVAPELGHFAPHHQARLLESARALDRNGVLDSVTRAVLHEAASTLAVPRLALEL